MASTKSKKDKATAATPSASYRRMSPRWRMMEVLLEGTEALRAAGDEFTPKHENETQRNYNARLSRTTLLNMTEQTLHTLSGRPFREPVVLGEDVPEQIAELCEDIDLQGKNLQAFCRNWFRTGWAKGLSHVLIEHPTPSEPEPGKRRTLADDRRENLRPYWVHIMPENLLAAYSEMIDGKEVLTHVRIREVTVERDGWEEVEKVRIRVLEPGTWELYEPNEKEDDWVLVDSGTSNLSFIPLVTFYSSERTSLMECKPPLTDLAHLNIAHWQSSSDQRNVLTVARFPILAAAGVPADQKISIGPNNYLTTDDVQGKWYYVEHSGAAIEAGAKDLSSLEDQMAAYGAEFMRKRPGNETATARALDSSESSSYLAATVYDFQDCVEQALWFTAQWLKQDAGGSVQISTEVDLDEADAKEMEALLKMRASRDISRRTLLDEMQKRAVLSDDFDADEDREFLDEEGGNELDMFQQRQPAQPAPGQLPPPDDGDEDDETGDE